MPDASILLALSRAWALFQHHQAAPPISCRFAYEVQQCLPFMLNEVFDTFAAMTGHWRSQDDIST
jgi:hypothetical protein